MTRGLAATGAIAITGDRCSTGCAGAGDCIFWKAADGCSLPAEALEEEEECCTGAFSEPRAEGAAGGAPPVVEEVAAWRRRWLVAAAPLEAPLHSKIDSTVHLRMEAVFSAARSLFIG